MEGIPPGSKANAEEAPHFQEARVNAEKAIPEANALPPMCLLASFRFSLQENVNSDKRYLAPSKLIQSASLSPSFQLFPPLSSSLSLDKQGGVV